ncbi:MAG TPA: invasion associated locus B family protein [Devosiaceae bacterium]|nr:invasion associated locus B family protein [Devosiaceae bacterium]
MKSLHRGIVSAMVLAGLAFGGAVPALAAPAKKPAAAKPASKPAATDSMAPTSIGNFSSWTAWSGKDSSGLICYVSAEPATSQPSGVKRDPVHFLIVDRKGLGTTNEVQTLIGYDFRKDSKPSSTIDGKVYPMVADGAGAWLASTGDEAGFVAAMKKGKSLVVKGTSLRGTETTDTYSLSGVTAALDAATKACS